MLTDAIDLRDVPRAMLEEGGAVLGFLLIAGLTLVVCLALAVAEQVKIRRSPVLTRTATVTDVEIREESSLGEVGKASTEITRRLYFITFRLAGGEEVKLQVPAVSACGIHEGDRGTLTCRGPKYIAFDSDYREGD